MNNVTLKLDFQGVEDSGLRGNTIDPKDSTAVLLKWAELAELLSQRITLPDTQHFKWYMHVAAAWEGSAHPSPKTAEGQAEVTVWQTCDLGGEYAVTKQCSITIRPDNYGMKFLGWIPIMEVVEKIAARFKETE